MTHIEVRAVDVNDAPALHQLDYNFETDRIYTLCVQNHLLQDGAPVDARSSFAFELKETQVDPPIYKNLREGAETQAAIEEKLRQKIHVEHFGGHAGAIMENENLQNYGYSAYADKENLHGPFLSELDWKVAQWAKLRGPSSAAITELLQIPTVSSLFFYHISKICL